MTSRDIPDPIKRIVRQKSGFGCVICGLPIFEYDHVEEFAVVQEHDPNNIVLLCRNHHGEKTAKRLTKEVVRQAAANPVNLHNERTAGHVFLKTGDLALFQVAGTKFEYSFGAVTGRFEAIQLNGDGVLALSNEDGNLLLDVSMHDRSGDEILRIVRGEMTISTGVWDYRIEGPTITMNLSERKISLELDLSPQGVTVRRGTIFSSPVELRISEDRYDVYDELGRRRIGIVGSGHIKGSQIGLVVDFR